MSVIDENSTCGQAVCQILAKLLDDLMSNESGIRAAADIDCLHNYRVALRRARVVVGRFRNILPAEAASYFSSELRWLGQLTSPLRDADTQLAALGEYRNWLPEPLSTSLEPFHDYLQLTRKSEHEKFIGVLTDSRYVLFMTYWRAFVERGPAEWNSRAWAIYTKVMREDIWRRYRKMVRRGGRIGPESPAEALHDLRKDGKKLRYLIEFLEMAAQDQETKKPLKHLRRLQDVLGRHQDLEVHADEVLKFGEIWALRGNTSHNSFLALGFLAGRLNGLQAMARDSFAVCFEKFSNKSGRRKFRALCKIAKAEPDVLTPVSL